MYEGAGVAERIDAAEAASRLGVKTTTLYSYVSRGLLSSAREPGERRSWFDAAEVLALHRRAHPARVQRPEFIVESGVTALGADRPFYRGRDALVLARQCGFEQVADWLWTGEMSAAVDPWRSLPGAVAAAKAVQLSLPSTTLPLDRLMMAVTALAVADPMRHSIETESVLATGRALVAGMVDALPTQSARAGRRGVRIADRLWPTLTKTPPTTALVGVLDAALVLLADHELAASTLAARVAASVGADPYAVVSAALGVLGGPLHGGASLGAERMLADIRKPEDAAHIIGERLRRGERIPGVGHAIYKAGDGRGGMLFELLREAAPQHPRLAAADAVLHELTARGLPPANCDFAVATLTGVCGMVTGAGEVVFAVARTAGWIAHALEEYTRTSPLRPRAVYVGPVIEGLE
jgi:citrate synthase